MKPTLIGLFILLMLAPTISRAAYQGENLFTNPGLELTSTTVGAPPEFVRTTTLTGRPETTYGETSGTPSNISSDDTQVHSGSKSLKMYMPIEPATAWRTTAGFYADNNRTPIANPDLAARTIRFSAWARSDGGPITQGVDFAVFVDNTGTPYSAISSNLVNYVGQYGNAINISTTWEEYWVEVSLAAGAEDFVPVIMCNNSAALTRETPLTVWVDDVDVYDKPLRDQTGVPVELSSFEME